MIQLIAIYSSCQHYRQLLWDSLEIRGGRGVSAAMAASSRARDLKIAEPSDGVAPQKSLGQTLALCCEKYL
jgi:hypothetical protein